METGKARGWALSLHLDDDNHGRQAVDQLEVRILNLGEGERKQSRNKVKNNCGVALAQRQIRRMKGGERREELQQSIRAFLLPPAPHFVCSHFALVDC